MKKAEMLTGPAPQLPAEHTITSGGDDFGYAVVDHDIAHTEWLKVTGILFAVPQQGRAGHCPLQWRCPGPSAHALWHVGVRQSFTTVGSLEVPRDFAVLNIFPADDGTMLEDAVGGSLRPTSLSSRHILSRL